MTSPSATARPSRPSGSARMARENVTVALVRRRRRRGVRRLPALSLASLEERVRAMLPAGLRRPVFGPLGAALPEARLGAAPAARQGDLGGAGARPLEAYFPSVSICSDRLRQRLFSRASSASCRATDAVEVYAVAYATVRQRGPLSQSAIRRFQDLSARRHPDQGRPRQHGQLARGARAAARPPLRRMGPRPAIALQAAQRRRQAYLQGGARALAAGRYPLPPEESFTIPLAAWLRGPLAETMRAALTGPRLRGTGLFDVAHIAGAIDQHERGRRDHSQLLWSLLMLRILPARRS